MRSEKETKAELNHCIEDEEPIAVRKQDSRFAGRVEGWIQALKWTLKGPPRYSVAELEKIVKIKTEDDTEFREWNGVFRFLEFLKDKKKVEEILK